MSVLESLAVPNILFLTLMVGLWSGALAIVTPGTGLFEILAGAALTATGLGLLRVPFEPWAFVSLALGGVLFVLALRSARPNAWLVLSALALSLGSAYLFGMQAWRPNVHPVLAVLVSLLTLSFFWIAIRKVLAAQRTKPRFDPRSVEGQFGEARTALSPVGTVYVAGELWSARAATPIAPGTRVLVRKREGLILTVEAAGEAHRQTSAEGGL